MITFHVNTYLILIVLFPEYFTRLIYKFLQIEEILMIINQKSFGGGGRKDTLPPSLEIGEKPDPPDPPNPPGFICMNVL